MHVHRHAHAYKRTFVIRACLHKVIGRACTCTPNDVQLLSTTVRDVVRADITRIKNTECPPDVRDVRKKSKWFCFLAENMYSHQSFTAAYIMIAATCMLLHAFSVGVLCVPVLTNLFPAPFSDRYAGFPVQFDQRCNRWRMTLPLSCLMTVFSECTFGNYCRFGLFGWHVPF